MPGLDLGHVPPDLSRHEPEIQNGAHAGRNLTAGPGKESHSGKKLNRAVQASHRRAVNCWKAQPQDYLLGVRSSDMATPRWHPGSPNSASRWQMHEARGAGFYITG